MTDLGALAVAVPVFVLAYTGVGMLLQSRTARSHPFKSRVEESKGNLRQFTQAMGRFGFNKMLLQNERFRARLELLLLRSGHIFNWRPEDLLFYKELSGILVLLLLWHNGIDQPLLWIIGPFGGFLLPEFYVKIKASARIAEIQRELPGFVDLLALALESGLDLMAAIERIIAKMKPTPLREELQALMQENRLGSPRKEALQHLSDRTGLSDLQSMTSMIIQSEELGTSLALVLRSYVEDMRNRRILRAEEVAGKAPVKLLFPMMVFFFPIVFVIIFGPMVLNFMSAK